MINLVRKLQFAVLVTVTFFCTHYIHACEEIAKDPGEFVCSCPSWYESYNECCCTVDKGTHMTPAGRKENKCCFAAVCFPCYFAGLIVAGSWIAVKAVVAGCVVCTQACKKTCKKRDNTILQETLVEEENIN